MERVAYVLRDTIGYDQENWENPQKAKNEKKAREKQNKQKNPKERKTSKTSLVKLHSSQVTGYKFWDKIPNEQKTIHPRLVLSLKGLCSVLAVLMAVLCAVRGASVSIRTLGKGTARQAFKESIATAKVPSNSIVPII
jgi:hypothetical protein